MSLNPDPNAWKGEHLIRVPRAPKAEERTEPPRGFVPKVMQDRVFGMARAGKTCPEIARDTGLCIHKVRNMLVSAGIEFKLAKKATVIRANADGKRKRG